MENINKIDRGAFIDVYVLKTLNEIKWEVKKNIKLDKRKEEEIDKKMSLLLKDLINSNFKNLQQDPKGNMIYTMLPIVDEKENEKVRLSLILYYTALYYDNVDLLYDLLKENISFNLDVWSISLQYLDISISSKFDRKKYVEMIKTCGYMFINFAKSIETLPQEEREKYIQRFEKLISSKYDLICNRLEKCTSYYNIFEYLFVKENLDTFSDETYKQATEGQLEMICLCCRKIYAKETCDRLNNLMQTKGFSNYLCNFDLMMKLYTDEELEKLDYNTSVAISKFARNEEGLNKIIDFIQKRPDLANRIVDIKEEDFMKTDNFTLIEVCDHFWYLYNQNFDLMKKAMKPKSILKRVLGAYKKGIHK
ncbi:MAG: hypothetical protein IJB83_00165 [Bacilli bacterium]|nr:hypothetical protein [Bacilli bacterium]